MDGFEVLKRLKQEPETQSISVVILTAYDTREYREKCQTLGSIEYLTKPISTEMLLSSISNALRDTLKI